MFSLYSQLFGLPQNLPGAKTKPNRWNSNPSLTELDPQGSNDLQQNKMNEKIRNIQQVYHLERRFLL